MAPFQVVAQVAAALAVEVSVECAKATAGEMAKGGGEPAESVDGAIIAVAAHVAERGCRVAGS